MASSVAGEEFGVVDFDDDGTAETVALHFLDVVNFVAVFWEVGENNESGCLCLLYGGSLEYYGRPASEVRDPGGVSDHAAW